MRIALKYGLLITLGVIAWVVAAHLLVPDPRSPVHSLGAGIFFNLLHIAGVYLAINTARNEAAGELIFKNGLKTGVATALVYAISSSLFFLVAIATVGPRLMAFAVTRRSLPNAARNSGWAAPLRRRWCGCWNDSNGKTSSARKRRRKCWPTC